MDSVKQKIERYKSEIHLYNSQADNYKTQLELLKTGNSDKLVLISELKEKLEYYLDANEDHLNKMNEYKTNNINLELKIEQFQKKLNVLLLKKEALVKDNKGIRGQVEDIRVEIKNTLSLLDEL